MAPKYYVYAYIIACYSFFLEKTITQIVATVMTIRRTVETVLIPAGLSTPKAMKKVKINMIIMRVVQVADVIKALATNPTTNRPIIEESETNDTSQTAWFGAI